MWNDGCTDITVTATDHITAATRYNQPYYGGYCYRPYYGYGGYYSDGEAPAVGGAVQ